jgi:hypothetical protein
MPPETIRQETGPGWRELLESLYDQIQAGREREAVLLRLLEQDREALVYLSRTGRPRPPTSTPRPLGEPLPLHKQILEAIAAQPGGMTRTQIEAAVGTQPLGGVLDGLCRRKRILRLGKGGFGLPGHSETGDTPQTKE